MKVARQRLSVLEMADALGNISEACRRSGMDRTSFYEWKRRFQTHGLEGLKDMPPIPKSQPNTTTPEVEAVILKEMSLYTYKKQVTAQVCAVLAFRVHDTGLRLSMLPDYSRLFSFYSGNIL